MIQVDVLFSNKIAPQTLGVNINQSICAVIDVIRATSTIAALLAQGTAKILVAGSKQEAYALKKKNRDYILCGEEGGLPPSGFDYGNSPLEISQIGMGQKTVILNTTNGTVSFLKVKDSLEAYALSLLNLNYTIDRICERLKGTENSLLLVCSGEGGRVAYDDVFVAGMAIKQILARGLKTQYSDAAKIALSMALSEHNLLGALEKSTSAKLLRGVGLGEDIAFCAKVDKYAMAGRLQHRDGQLQIVPS